MKNFFGFRFMLGHYLFMIIYLIGAIAITLSGVMMMTAKGPISLVPDFLVSMAGSSAGNEDLLIQVLQVLGKVKVGGIGAGLTVIIFGNIFFRIQIEALVLLLSLHKNIIDVGALVKQRRIVFKPTADLSHLPEVWDLEEVINRTRSDAPFRKRLLVSTASVLAGIMVLGFSSYGYASYREKKERLERLTSVNEQIQLASIKASSTLEGDNSRYKASNLIDSRDNTAWCEGKDDDGIGTTVNYEFKNEKLVKGMTVVNGFNSYFRGLGNVYPLNNRVAKLKVTFSNNKEEIIELTDGKREAQVIEFSQAVPASTVGIELLAVYKGSRWSDTCMSQLIITGREVIPEVDN